MTTIEDRVYERLNKIEEKHMRIKDMNPCEKCHGTGKCCGLPAAISGPGYTDNRNQCPSCHGEGWYPA